MGRKHRKEIYRQVFIAYKEMCARGEQPGPFKSFCIDHGVESAQMPQVLKGEFQKVTTLPGYRMYTGTRVGEDSRRALQVYEDFKRLCSSGGQKISFKSYCGEHGLSSKNILQCLRRRGIRLADIPGYRHVGTSRSGSRIRPAADYEAVFDGFKSLCSQGKQPGSLKQYCDSEGVSYGGIKHWIKKRGMRLSDCEGYDRFFSQRILSECGKRGLALYEEFKSLCGQNRQPCSFSAFCARNGLRASNVMSLLRTRGTGLSDIPGYRGRRPGKAMEVPFENVIFEEAGFLPAENNVITVSVDGHVAVSFPVDTDIAVVAKFVMKMGKEAGHVGA